MWPRVNDKLESSTEKILCSPFFLVKKYEPLRLMNSPSLHVGRSDLPFNEAFRRAWMVSNTIDECFLLS